MKWYKLKTLSHIKSVKSGLENLESGSPGDSEPGFSSSWPSGLLWQKTVGRGLWPGTHLTSSQGKGEKIPPVTTKEGLWKDTLLSSHFSFTHEWKLGDPDLQL